MTVKPTLERAAPTLKPCGYVNQVSLVDSDEAIHSTHIAVSLRFDRNDENRGAFTQPTLGNIHIK